MWLIKHTHFIVLESAARNGFVETAEHRIQIEAVGFGPERISAVKGQVANINITGILTQEPDIMAMLFGGGNTTYPEIIGAVAAANSDKDVKEISIFIDSPGGQVAGMFQAMDAIRDSVKPVTVIIGNMAASAAFGLASQGDRVLASHRSTASGSIGTAASFFVDDNQIDIASDNAPNKRPDVQTDEGLKAVKQELNQMAALFDESIAAGRKTTVKKVNANFGKGGMLLAEDAIEQGMIDGMVGDVPKKAASTSASSKPKEAPAMDLKQLMAEHSVVHAEAVAQGVAQEQKRVSAHLSSGETCGDMSIAIKAISDGTEYGDPVAAASYMNANMKKTQVAASAADDQALSAAADGSEAPAAPKEITEAEKNAEITLAAVEASMGVSANADGRDFFVQGSAK